MTPLSIKIATFSLAIATIAMLYIILMVTDRPPKVWRNGLFSCMVLLCAGVFLIFVPHLSDYAPMVGMAGVFLMIGCVMYVRWNEAKGKVFEGSTRIGFAIRATIFVAVGGLVAAPFFWFSQTQDTLKASQYGIIGLLVDVTKKLDANNNLLERDHTERVAKAKRDSVFQAENLKNQQAGLKLTTGIAKEQKDVKQTLKRQSKSRPAIIIMPTSRPIQITTPDYRLPTVKPPLPAPAPVRHGRKTSMTEQEWDSVYYARY